MSFVDGCQFDINVSKTPGLFLSIGYKLSCIFSPALYKQFAKVLFSDTVPLRLGSGNTQVFDDAEIASIIQTGESFPAQVSVVDSSPDLGAVDGGGGGFGGLLMMGLPVLLLLAALGGGAGLTAATTATPAAAAAASGCPVCTTPVQATCPTTAGDAAGTPLAAAVTRACPAFTTQVQATCPTTAAQCSPRAACPAGFAVVVNGNPNKCYRVLATEAANYAAASVACATVGGSLFEPGTTTELNAVRAIIPDAIPAADHYIGFTDIGAVANNPTGIHTGVGLPANEAIPAFDGTLQCVLVKKTGPYTISPLCVSTARPLCEARLDKINCVCPS
ncbi:Hypothetical predicted protein [Mytilus galloprovincialis]|uniref:C-type lectin domain-containing protein n=1 Tax=Mytilus galloprovincialis TaxID=29158 RepID=A0A8B6FTY9_MYTGA|nr:Hypothetical predicted protein [Mytilus galloprovincialis]